MGLWILGGAVILGSIGATFGASVGGSLGFLAWLAFNAAVAE